MRRRGMAGGRWTLLLLRRQGRRSCGANRRPPIPRSGVRGPTPPSQGGHLAGRLGWAARLPPRPSLLHLPASCRALCIASLHQRLDPGSSEGGNWEPRNNNPTAAASSSSWLARFLPARLMPFAYLARLDKPVGTWLLAWPCLWSITFAAPSGSIADIKMLFLFGFGAVLLRGAGCTVNDLLDQEIDKKVERTKLRPIAAGDLTTFQGMTFLGFQLLLGLGVLLQLNNFSQVLGAASLLLVVSYPLMKRWTYWAQAYLGLTFNWGALLGWAAIRGSLDPFVVLPLYVSGICWTLVYDTIYAHQDKEDDIKAGVKSTALLFADRTHLWLSVFGVTCISGLMLTGYNAGIGWPFYVSILAASGHLMWQIGTVDLNSSASCNSRFVSNIWLGATVFIGASCGKLIGI